VARKVADAQWSAAISVLQVVLLKLKDPRLAAERDRLKRRAEQTSREVSRLRDDALAAARVKDHHGEAELWSKLAEASPKDLEAHVRAAAAVLRMGDGPRAVTLAQKAVQLAPKSLGAHKLLLRAYEQNGQSAQAATEREVLKGLTSTSDAPGFGDWSL
jgi:Flp pilus assembly protein TadD